MPDYDKIIEHLWEAVCVPHYDNAGNAWEYPKKVQDAAYAAIEAIDSLTTTRVMTLDEVLTAEDFVWAEIYTPNKWSWCVIYVKIIPIVSNDEIVRIEEDCGTGWTKSKSDYGKRGFLDGGWRCWTAKPTDERRKAVKWGE